MKRRSNWLRRLLRFVRQSTLLHFFENWAATRSYRLLACAVPAMVVFIAGAAAYAVYRQDISDKTGVETEYRETAFEALSRRDYPLLQICAKRVVDLRPDDDQFRFLHALAIFENGDHSLGRRKIRALAPDDEQGYGHAHWWIVTRILKEHPNPGVLVRDRLLHHTRRTVAALPDHVHAHHLLGRLLLDGRDFEQAVHHLRRAASQRPEAGLLLARVLNRTGRSEAALKEAESAERLLKTHISSSPNDTAQRILLAQSLVFQARFEAAVEVLDAGLQSIPDSQSLLDAQIRTYIAWHDSLPSTEMAKKLELLSAAIDRDANHPTLLALLARQSLERVHTERSDQPVEKRDAADQVTGQADDVTRSQALGSNPLANVLAEGKAPAAVHLILGTQAAVDQDWNAAELHLRQAHAGNPDIPDVLNNLAWVLMKKDDPDPHQAIALASAATRLVPRHAAYHDTRGFILEKLGQRDEAIQALERAVQLGIKSAETFRRLSGLYQSAGDAETAAAYEQRAQSVELGSHRQNVLNSSPSGAN